MKHLRFHHDHSIVENVFLKTLFSYVASTLAYSIGPLVDGIVMGNYLGVDSVAAYGMVWPAILVYALIGAIISGGSRNVYTGLVAHGQTEKANKVFTLAMLMNFIVSAILGSLVYLCPDLVARLLGAYGQTAHLADPIIAYLRGFVIGVPFMNAAKILSGYMSIDSDGSRNIVSVIFMTVADVIGDIITVYVIRGGMFALGVTTSAGNIVQFAILMLHFTRKKRILAFIFNKLGKCFRYLKDVIVNGAPSGVTRIASAVAGVLINRMLAQAAGGEHIAAYSVMRSVASLVSMTYLGVADTVWIMSSVYYGEEDQKALNSLQLTAFRTGLTIVCPVAVMLLLFPGFFARLYIGQESQSALGLAREAIRVLAFCLPLYLIVYAYDDYMMGTGHIRNANIFSFFLEGGILVPSVYLMIRFFGGRGVWYGVLISLILMMINTVQFIDSMGYGNIFDIKRLLLYEGFGAENGEEMSISASSEVEIMGMSRIAHLFCQENGIDKKRAFNLALCVEEMGMNVLEHGFDGKPHVIDIRFLIKDEELILRIRDDCRPFNPVERYNLTVEDSEDPMKNVGIRMVMKMARDVQYYNISDTNNLIIKI